MIRHHTQNSLGGQSFCGWLGRPLAAESFLALFIVLLFAVLPSFDFFQEYELKAFDLLFRLKRKLPALNIVTHIDIDDKSVAKIGKWPWSREKHATLIRILNECGAKMIAFDVLFIESGRALPKSLDSKEQLGTMLAKLSDSISPPSQPISPSLLEEVRTMRAFLEEEIILEDREFYNALRQSRAQIFLPFYIPLDERESQGEGAEISLSEDRFAEDVSVKAAGLRIPVAKKVTMPISAFLPYLAGSGFVNGEPDLDGVMRRIPLLWKVGNHFYTNLFLEVSLRHLGIEPPRFLVTKNEVLVYQAGDLALRIPITPQGEMFVNWTGKWPGGFIHIPYSGVLLLDQVRRDKSELFSLLDQKYGQGEIAGLKETATLLKAEDRDTETSALEEKISQKEKDLLAFLEKNFARGKERFLHEPPSPAFLDLSRDFALVQKLTSKETELKEKITSYVKDKICIIGLTATGTQDLKPTPLHATYPMVGMNSNMINTLVTRNFIRRIAEGWNIFFVALSGIAILLITVLSTSGWAALLTLLYLVLYGAAAFLAFDRIGIWMNVVSPLGCAGLTFATITTVRYAVQSLEKNRIKTAFQSYLSQEVVAEILKNPSKLKLGGEMRNMTLLFADIRGFTAISEQFDAQGLTHFINRFLTPMTEIVLKHRGTIDKYMGDCIMAFWNAPVEDPEHARHACEAALDMRACLADLNRKLEEEARDQNKPFQPIEIGIGLNTGDCCVGNMGSAQRFDYSVLGDEVNLAARFEGQSKTYGVDILIGQNTCAQSKGLAALELDLIRAKGKNRPVHIFALLGDETLSEAPEFKELRKHHDAMLFFYRGRDWVKTKNLIEECRKHDREQKLKILYELYRSRIASFELAPPAPDWDGVYIALSK